MFPFYKTQPETLTVSTMGFVSISGVGGGSQFSSTDSTTWPRPNLIQPCILIRCWWRSQRRMYFLLHTLQPQFFWPEWVIRCFLIYLGSYNTANRKHSLSQFENINFFHRFCIKIDNISCSSTVLLSIKQVYTKLGFNISFTVTLSCIIVILLSSLIFINTELAI